MILATDLEEQNRPMRNTFTCISAHLVRSVRRGVHQARRGVHSARPHLHQARRGTPLAAARRRGFTLIELMVVVVIITIMTAIALPGISRRLNSSHTKEAADRIGDIYRSARLRALGRGAAVLVRYNAGVFTVREAIWGPTAAVGCQNLPIASCQTPTTRWDAASTEARDLETFDFAASGDFVVQANAGGVQPTVDVCFTPSGRSFSRTNVAALLVPMTAGVRFSVNHTGGGGFQRSVVVSPTGNARTVATP